MRDDKSTIILAGGHLITLFFSWWYGEKLKEILKYFQAFLAYLYDFFSVRICLSTLFAVWKRDLIDYSHLGIKEIFQAWTLNSASRLIGFCVKIVTIFSFLVVSIIFSILYLAFFIFWLLFPAVIVGLLYFGIKNII